MSTVAAANVCSICSTIVTSVRSAVLSADLFSNYSTKPASVHSTNKSTFRTTISQAIGAAQCKANNSTVITAKCTAIRETVKSAKLPPDQPTIRKTVNAAELETDNPSVHSAQRASHHTAVC